MSEQQKQGAKRRVPLRKCSGCGEMKPKKELVRVIRTPENEVVLDLTGKKNGRGAYICRNEACFAKAKKTKVFERSLEVSIPEEIYDLLSEEMIQNNHG